MNDSIQPIGVFDSGVGGLTVLRDLIREFPNEKFIYLADTARVPYGNKSPETIRNASLECIALLLKKNVKAIIVACNSASSVLVEDSVAQVPLYKVIEPTAETALAVTQNKKIGIIGTKATITSKAYPLALKQRDFSIETFSQACPLFVPLIEEDWGDDPLTNIIVYRYLAPFLATDIDTLILGCTHYGLLKSSIQKALGTHVQLVESASAMVATLKKEFDQNRISPNQENSHARVEVLATDMNENFVKLANRILVDILAHDHITFANV